ncbi:MAG: flagellar biosynthesis anti-sigma factor FlgM [Defluviitaleaceae bacterium]|nr:flagellar biosynthesis anti-sigma factor FlgM [Defluviitaleaceae bacterium]
MDMRISSVMSAYSAQTTRPAARTARTDSRAAETDRVSLSAQAGEYQTARRAIANTPDIRESLVNRIQEMLDAGTYRVSSQDVATSILRG